MERLEASEKRSCAVHAPRRPPELSPFFADVRLKLTEVAVVRTPRDRCQSPSLVPCQAVPRSRPSSMVTDTVTDTLRFWFLAFRPRLIFDAFSQRCCLCDILLRTSFQAVKVEEENTVATETKRLK